MLSTLFLAITPLALAVFLGFFIGQQLTPALIQRCTQSLTPVVWGILWVIGVGTGAALSSFEQGLYSLKIATLFAGSTSVAILLVLAPFSHNAAAAQTGAWWQNLVHPLKQALIAFSLVGLGIAGYHLGAQQLPFAQMWLDIDYWLFALLWLIGVELTQIQFSRAWLAWPIVRVPLFAAGASLIAGALIALFSDIHWPVALALSSGFGWFSLSGALASQHLGEHYGAVALLTDLMRELFGILVVYVIGPRFVEASVGVCGATAADTTLPFIRQACGREYIPVALMTGLVLTLLGPLLMLFFMKLA